MSFFRSIIEEMSMVHTPTKKELHLSFVTVIFLVTLFSLIIMMTDLVVSEVVSSLLR